MVVAQGLALATTEAALYLHQSAQSLWRAWQSSANINPSALHPSSSTSNQLGLEIQGHPPTSPHLQHSSSSHSIVPQDTRQDTTPEMPSIDGGSKSWLLSPGGVCSGRSVLSDPFCRVLRRVEAVVAAMSHATDPREGITLLLPLAVLVVGGLAAAWCRGGMPLPGFWAVRVPAIMVMAGRSWTRKWASLIPSPPLFLEAGCSMAQKDHSHLRFQAPVPWKSH